MASQAFLNATKQGSYATPTEWTALADSWQASSFSATVTEAWILAGINSPSVATILVSRGVDPAEYAVIRPVIMALGSPTLQNGLAALAAIKGVEAAGVNLNSDQKVTMVSTFFQEMLDFGVQVGNR